MPLIATAAQRAQGFAQVAEIRQRGVRHTRGTPPAVVEIDAATWIALATGDLTWDAAEAAGRVRASRRARRPHAVPPAR